MTLSDFTLNDFDSLEEAANEIAHKMNITGGDQLNVLRYQIFTHWHDEVGFSWEDKEYIGLCYRQEQRSGQKMENPVS